MEDDSADDDPPRSVAGWRTVDWPDDKPDNDWPDKSEDDDANPGPDNPSDDSEAGPETGAEIWFGSWADNGIGCENPPVWALNFGEKKKSRLIWFNSVETEQWWVIIFRTLYLMK